MGLIPRVFLDDLLQQTDIVTLIDHYVPLKKQGVNFSACCPFHQEKNPSFSVIPKKQFYHCFGCGAHGNAISFIMEHLKQSFPEAIETLAARVGLTVPRDDATPHLKTSFNELNQRLYECAHFYHTCLFSKSGALALQYLQQRAISPQTIQQFQLGYAPEGWRTLEKIPSLASKTQDLLLTGMLIQKEESAGHYDRYRHRLMFPIHNKQGQIIGFGGRALSDDQKPKYLNSPETPLFHKSKELYGLYQLLQQQTTPCDFILIVEGYMDVLMLVQAGIPSVVATLGTSVNATHLQRLATYTQHIIFCFDGDEAGQAAAWRGLEQCFTVLNSSVHFSFVFLPPEHDPDSFIRAQGKAAFLEKIQNAHSWSDFFIAQLTKKSSVDTLSGKNQFLHAVKPYLLKMPDSPSKSLLLQEISRLTHLDPLLLTDQLKYTKEAPSFRKETLSIQRTPLRIAIALLLQAPEHYKALAFEYPPEQFLKDPNHRLLSSLMNIIIKTPHPHTASLIESFRESEFFQSLQKLAIWDLAIPSSTIKKELQETLFFIIREQEKKEVQSLIMKAKQTALSSIEQQRLQNLLKQTKTVRL